MGFEWGWADINWIAIVVAFVANMVLGLVWYHRKVFGGVWMDNVGKTAEEIRSGNMLTIMGSMIVMVFVTTISLALVIGNIGGGLAEGMVVGAVVGFGIAAANAIPHYTFAQQPNRLALLNTANTGVGITLSGLIIGAFNA